MSFTHTQFHIAFCPWATYGVRVMHMKPLGILVFCSTLSSINAPVLVRKWSGGSACPHLNLHVLQQPKNPRSSLFWMVSGGDFCRSSSRVLMRPSQKHVTQLAPLMLVLSLLKPSQNLKPLSSPKGAHGQGGSVGMLISGTKMSTADTWQSQFLTWSIPRTLPCGLSRTDKLPPLTSSSITKCFCAGLVKTPKTLLEFSYLRTVVGPFTGFGHVWVFLRHYHTSQVDLWTFWGSHVSPGVFNGVALGGLFFLYLRSQLFSLFYS